MRQQQQQMMHQMNQQFTQMMSHLNLQNQATPTQHNPQVQQHVLHNPQANQHPQVQQQVYHPQYQGGD